MQTLNYSQPQPTAIIGQNLKRLAFAFLICLVSTVGILAQSPTLGSRLAVIPNMGNREGVTSINQEIWTEIRFLDARGNHATAPANINVILTATVLSDMVTAKRNAEWQTRNLLDKARLVLPKSRDGAVVQGIFPAGWKSVWVSVKSERGGAIKVIAEGEQVITGSAVINVSGPNKLAITVNPTSIPLSSYASVEISLLDYNGSQVAADANYNLTVTATGLVSLNRAERAPQTQQYLRSLSLPRSLDGQALVLPRGETTAKLTGWLQKNKSKVTLRFKSEFSGTVRLYVQGDGLFPAGMPVAVTARYSQLRFENSFKDVAFGPRPEWAIPVSFQPEIGAPVPPRPALPLKLKIEGYNVSEEVKDTFRFKIFLYDQNDQPVNAPNDVLINLKLDDVNGKAELAPVSLLIPRGKSLNDKPVEVRSSCDKELIIRAATQTDGINSVSERINFNPPRRATTLDVQTAPTKQVASGWNAINLRVSALNDCGEPIRAEEENLGAGRPIAFTFERALRFDGDDNTLIIPAGSFSEAKKVFSSGSGDFKITATDQSNRQVTWMGDISFYFPWVEFISAIIGGLLWPLISHLPKLLWKTVAQGAVSGAIGFGLALFGAIVTEQAKLGDLTINLLRLPMTSWLPAGIMGFVGYLLISGVISVPSLAKKVMHKGTGKEQGTEANQAE